MYMPLCGYVHMCVLVPQRLEMLDPLGVGITDSVLSCLMSVLRTEDQYIPLITESSL